MNLVSISTTGHALNRTNLIGLVILRTPPRTAEEGSWKCAVLCTLLVLSVTGCMGGRAGMPPIEVAHQIDLNRMYGGWYILATIPNWFEKGLVEPYDVYSPQPDGSLREDFFVRSGGFGAPIEHHTVYDWVKPNSGNARWQVQLFWPLKLPFLVLYTDPDYRYVLFGEENRSAGWIYAREPDMDEATYQSLLEQFRNRGYDPTKFRRWIQSPEQIGVSGFWSNGVRPSR